MTRVTSSSFDHRLTSEPRCANSSLLTRACLHSLLHLPRNNNRKIGCLTSIFSHNLCQICPANSLRVTFEGLWINQTFEMKDVCLALFYSPPNVNSGQLRSTQFTTYKCWINRRARSPNTTEHPNNVFYKLSFHPK